jgi:hypothetical protein
MNWGNYKFFSVWCNLTTYQHFFLVDGNVFTHSKSNINCFFKIKDSSSVDLFEKIEHFPLEFEKIEHFPLENEVNNYISSIKYWNLIHPNSKTYNNISRYIKIINRETNLEKILNSI